MDFTETFDILELRPIRRRNVWMAVVAIKQPVEIDGQSMANGAKVTVRLSYDDSGSVEGLLEAVYSEVKRCLQSASDILESQSLADLRDLEESHRAEIEKPFEMPWDSQPQTDAS